MHPAIPLLRRLQKTDQQIASFRAELEAAPKRIREVDSKLNGARAAVASAKEAHSHLITGRKTAELDVAQWRERATRFRSQSSAVKTNEAYKALQQEIAHADAEASKAEDAQLEQMMAVEEAEKNVKAAEAALRGAEQTVAVERKEIENRAREAKRKMDADLAAREKLAADIPEEVLEQYSRAAKRHHGVGLAEAVGEQCRGCGIRLLPHVYQEVRRAEDHEIRTCENCGRILYSAEQAGPPAASAAPGANPPAASGSQ